MTQQEKQLLLKDLCGRLPYSLKVQCDKYPRPVTILYAGNINEVKFEESGGIEHVESIKPYLRPMSSMTEEELSFYNNHLITPGITILEENLSEYLDWMYSHHFDYRRLIEKGLALEAPEGMYKTK